MKSSLGKLRKFALLRSDDKEKKERQHMLRLDELDQASQLLLYQDMQDMRSCYDNLLSAAAAATNSVYEFSESLQDIGTCFLQKAALNDDDESYKLLSMLGEAQFGLQKLFDRYRGHILLTITTPSESLLKDLRTVEEMKLQCDEKRKIYEHIAAQYQEKGKSRSGKGESVFSQQLKAARDEYVEVESFCIFRLKSLKQGQWRSLLTQAARHHAAQMSFFKKGLKSLEAIEPLLNRVTKKQHIDYQLDGFEDGGNGDDVHVNSYGSSGDEESCFVYRENKQVSDAISGSRNSTEGNQPLKVESRWSSYSAPIFPEKKFNPGYKIRDLPQVPARKSHSYVLPTPDDAKHMNSGRANSSVPKSRPVSNVSGSSHQSQWHSSPLQQPQKEVKDFIDVNPLGSVNSKSKVKASSNTTPPSVLFPSLQGSSDGKKPKRQAFSGPLSSKATSGAKPFISVSGPISITELPHQITSGGMLLSRVPVSISPKVSPASSPPIASSPKISELHELPRPPPSGGKSSGVVVPPKPVASSSGYSGPLILKNQEPPPPLNKSSHVTAFSNPTPLPIPPLAVHRSFSIPSSNQRAMATHMAKLLESPQHCEKAVEVSSPPLTPISLSKIKPLLNGSEVDSQWEEQLRRSK